MLLRRRKKKRRNDKQQNEKETATCERDEGTTATINEVYHASVLHKTPTEAPITDRQVKINK